MNAPATMLAPSSSESRSPQGERSESISWGQIARPLYLPQELMGFAEGTGLLWLAGMANGVRFTRRILHRNSQFSIIRPASAHGDKVLIVPVLLAARFNLVQIRWIKRLGL